jgi:hypothetical protein
MPMVEEEKKKKKQKINTTSATETAEAGIPLSV